MYRVAQLEIKKRRHDMQVVFVTLHHIQSQLHGHTTKRSSRINIEAIIMHNTSTTNIISKAFLHNHDF